MIKVKSLQVFSTPEGTMIPIYHDWDDWNEGYIPQMAYVTTMQPSTSKGPILHERRTAYLTAVSGTVELEYIENGVMNSMHLKDGIIKAVIIPPGVPIKLINHSLSETAIVINLPRPAWKPDDQDTIKFVDWNEYDVWCKENVK